MFLAVTAKYSLPKSFVFLFSQFFQAVQDYIHAQRVLQQYGNMASFQGIQSECEAIVEELQQKLRDQFKSKEVTVKCCVLMKLFCSYTGLFISPSGISELDCATTKTDTAERSISIGRESLQGFFFLY